MSNKGFFTGRVAKAPAYRDGAKTTVCYATLIRDEYAGKDADSGEAKERKVAIDFTAFGPTAKAIFDHVLVGDQLHVEYHLANNNVPDKDTGEIKYGFSFILDEFEFGAPGELKREKLRAGRA